MPGTIRVSVLEAVDLAEVLTDGPIGKDVTAKGCLSSQREKKSVAVTLGLKLFKTQPGVAAGGRIASWNSDFAFPVMNLRDKLVISICDSEDHSVTQTAIEIPSIIQKGSRDEFVALNKGGRIHLRMSFVLSEEERKKIEIMRVAALQRKEEAERLKKTVIIQPVTPEKELKKSPVSTVAIKEVDLSTTVEWKANGSLGDKKDLTILGDKEEFTAVGDKKDSTTTDDKKDATILGDKKNSTPKPPAPKPLFNYAKAIGMPPSAKKSVKKPSAAVSDCSSNELKGDNSSGLQTGRESAKDAGEVVSSETTKLDASPVEAPGSGDGAAPLVTKTIDSTPLIPAGESGNVTNEVKANNGDVNSDSAQSEGESAEELGSTMLDGPAPAVAKPADSAAQAITEVESGVPENSTNEVGEADMDSKPQAVRRSAGDSEEVSDSSGNSEFLESSSAVDASLSSEDESSSLMITSTDSVSGEHLQLSIQSSTITLETVKAQLKRTLSRASSRRSSNCVSSYNSLSRTPPPVLVVWVQDCVRRALSKVKGCYGLCAQPSTVKCSG